jgi:hypothetical protein
MAMRFRWLIAVASDTGAGACELVWVEEFEAS